MDANAILQNLERRMREPLPGIEAKRPLSPLPDRGRLDAEIPAGARPAAVLIQLVSDEGLWIPMMRRRELPADRHSGQISFPGGSVEAGEGVIEAALRESREELGLDPEGSSVLGQLSPQWIPVSGFVVYPVVAVGRARQALECDPDEVAEGFWVNLMTIFEGPVLTRPGRSGELEITMRGWELEQGFLWGATAMILAELLAMISGREGPRSEV